MEAKKTSRSDLENKRFIFREIGLVVALAMVFFAFETKYYQEEAKEIIIPVDPTEVEEVLPIFVPQKASQPLPKASMKPIDIIDIVPDEMELDDNLEIIDDNDNTKGSLTGTDTNWDGIYDENF